MLPALERVADAAGGWSRVESLAVGLGPGSFTGIRIGVATALGLRAALGRPVAGICTLDALARGMAESAGERDRLAVLDARRGEVYAALYSSDGDRLWEPLVSAPQELAERLRSRPGAPLGGGSGAVRFRHELAGGIEIPDDSDPVHRVSALHVCALGAAAAETATGALEPIYLRPPDAERWRERDTAKRSR